MSVSVSCPSCRTSYRVEETLLGRKARCAQCRARFVLTREAPPPPASSPWPWISGPAPTGDRPVHEQGRGETSNGWQPGDVIDGLYEVREVFTSGGMGLVYRVRHRGWNVELAVKCPRPEYFQHEEDKENFEREAETWVKLGLHPNAVTCYYVRRLGGIPHVFAEYVGGGSLAEWIRTGKLYEGRPETVLARILDVAVQFARGLSHAHEQGLIHRDVKPGNVLLTPSGVAKVTDFGMARARGGTAAVPIEAEGRTVLVSSGGLTPAFCSPEQVLGEPVSRKTDIWSWGVSVLEMFTGPATWSAGYLASVALEDYLAGQSPRGRLPQMPAALVELLRQCFQRDPTARPRDMVEIEEILYELYRNVTGQAYPRPEPPETEALPDVLNNRAVSLLDLRKQDEAEQLWEEALAAAPGHPEAAYNLGLYRWRAGRLSDEELRVRLREVCALHPGEWRPRYLLAAACGEMGDWASASAALGEITGPAARFDEVRAARAAALERAARTCLPLRCYRGHRDWVSAVRLSADGRRAVSAGADRTVRLWEVSTGRCLRVYEGHGDWVTAADLSGDGRLILSGSADTTLRLWDSTTGECLRVLAADNKWVLAACLDLYGEFALSGGGDGRIHLWDLEDGSILQTFSGHDGPVLALVLSPDSRHLLSGGRDGTARLWDVASGAALQMFSGHADKVHAVALSADGRRVLTGSADRTLKVWETATGQCLATLSGHAGPVTAACLTPCGSYAVSGSGDRTVRYWRLDPVRCLATLEAHARGVNAISLGIGNGYAMSGSGDRTLLLWRLPGDVRAPYRLARVLPSEEALAGWADFEQALARAWQALSQQDMTGAVRALQIARSLPGLARRPEAMDLWTSLYVRRRRTSLDGGWERDVLEGHLDAVTAVAVSADGRLALSGSADRTLRLWEVATGHCLRTLEGHGSAVTAVCFSHNGRYALSGSADATLRLWELDSGRCVRTFEGHQDVVTAVALGRDGRLATSGSIDHTLRLWDAATGRCLHVFPEHLGPVHVACLSADGQRAVSGSGQSLVRGDERLFTGGQLRLWDVPRGRCLHTFVDHADAVTTGCLSPDERYFLWGGGRSAFKRPGDDSSPSGVLGLHETSTGRSLATWAGHEGAVTAVSATADGRHAFSAGTEGTIKAWDLTTTRCLRTFTGHSGAVTSLALSRDARYVLSAGVDRLVKVWLLDWRLLEDAGGAWDEGAEHYLKLFLSQHRPYGAALPRDQRGRVRALLDRSLGRSVALRLDPDELTRALTRRGPPVWTEEDFEDLLYLLGCAGYGGLSPEAVRQRLAEMARNGQERPSGPAE